MQTTRSAPGEGGIHHTGEDHRTDGIRQNTDMPVTGTIKRQTETKDSCLHHDH